MDFMDAIYRRAVREFKKRRGKSGDDPLHHRCRRSGAERVNRQPWFFVVIEDQAALERYSCNAKAHLVVAVPESAPLGQYRALLKPAAP